VISSSAFQKLQITVELCDNDADTSIVKVALAAVKDDSVEVVNPLDGCCVVILCLIISRCRQRC